MDPDDFNDEHEAEVVLDDLDPNNPDDSFAILERDYNKLVAELEEDQNLSKYLDEYAKLFDYLYNTREQAINLSAAKVQLEDELATNEARLNSTTKTIKIDGDTIVNLKSEIEKSHKLIDNAHAREQAAQEVIDNLRKQISNLNAEIEFKNRMAQGELEENPLVAKHREGLEREKVKLISEVAKLNEKLNNALSYQEQLERRTSLTDLKIVEINTRLEETAAEVDKYRRNKGKLEIELEDQRMELLRKQQNIEIMSNQLKANEKIVIRQDSSVKETSDMASKCFKELEKWNSRYCKMQNEYDALKYQTGNLRKDHEVVQKNMQLKDDEARRLQMEFGKLIKMREHADYRTKMITYEKLLMSQDREKLRDQIHWMKNDIEDSKQKTDADKRKIENHIREQDIIKKNLIRHKIIGKEHMKVIKIYESMKNKLDTEIDGHINERHKQTKQISYLEKERDRFMEEALDMNKKMDDAMEQMRIQKALIYDLKKCVAENENKLRMQQNLFDATKADRNALKKTLHECNADNNSLKNKLRINQCQNEQLKEEIATKEQKLIKGDAIVRKISKEKDEMKVELNNSSDHIRKLKSEMTERKSEEKRIHQVIVVTDRKNREQGKLITTLMNERDILGSQLVRRNDELLLLYEKVKLLQTTLHRGVTQYDQRLEDIKLLKVEIKRIRQEKSLLTNSINNMNDLKVEVFHLHRDLTRERLKSKALEDELHNPMNVHRWRKLEGSDPDVFVLLQKITLLQKRLLNQTSHLMDREKQLKEVEKLYTNLRHMLAKQPGPEIYVRLSKTQQALFSSTNHMKCLVSELNMVEIQNREYNLNLMQANSKLNSVKVKLANERKKRFKHANKLRAITQETDQAAAPSVKYAGGGFRMSVSAIKP